MCCDEEHTYGLRSDKWTTDKRLPQNCGVGLIHQCRTLMLKRTKKELTANCKKTMCRHKVDCPHAYLLTKNSSLEKATSP